MAVSRLAWAGIGALVIATATFGVLRLVDPQVLAPTRGAPEADGRAGATEPAGLPEGSTPTHVRTVLVDRFETGTSGWKVTRRADGRVTTLPGAGPAGSSALALTVPEGARRSSVATLRHRLPEPSYGVLASGRFKVVSAGCDRSAHGSRGNVPFFRLFDTADTRRVGVFRINGDCDRRAHVTLQHSGDYHPTETQVALGEWNRVELWATVRESGPDTVTAFLNGELIYEALDADNGSRPFAGVGLHNELPRQTGGLLVDDVRVATFDPAASEPNCEPRDGWVPRNDEPGRVVLADGFESADSAGWRVVDRGRAVVDVTSAAAYRDSCGLHLWATDRPDAEARATVQLPPRTHAVRTDGWFRVQQDGLRGEAVPLIGLRAGERSVLVLERANDGGGLWTRTPGALPTSLGVDVALGGWHRVQTRVTVDGARDRLEVLLDGETIYRAPTRLGADRLSAVVLGSTRPGSLLELDVDDLVVKVER